MTELAPPPVAIVIPTWNGCEDLHRCLASLPSSCLADVVVVDNGSVDGTGEMLAASFPGVRVIRLDDNTGFAYAVNVGIDAAAPRDVVLLNNDVQVEPDWWDELSAAAASAAPGVGFIASKIVRADNRLIDSAGDVQTWSGLPAQRGHDELDKGQWDDAISVFSACGGASWFRRQMFDDVGTFDPRFFAYYEDVDLCSRAQLRGWTGLFAPRAVVRHGVSATSSRVTGFKTFQSTRNSWWLLVRTMPRDLLGRVLPRFLFVHLLLLLSAVRKGEAGAALRGHAAGLAALPRLLRERRTIQAGAAVSADAFAAAFAPTALRRLIRHSLGAVVWRRLGTPVESWGDPYTRPRHNADAALRYRRVAGLLPEAVRVLEVGSGSAGITAYADLPFVVGVDADFAATAELTGRRLHRVSATGAALPFTDGAFDAVVSVDALEHVPREARASFVAELLRVTRPGGRVLLAAPVGPAGRLGDWLIRRRYRRLHGADHPWLTEHTTHGLPSDRDIRAALGAAQFRVHRNGWLPLWILLQREALGHKHREPVERLWGELAARAPWPPAYRKIYEIGR